MSKTFILVDDDTLANLINRRVIERNFPGGEMHSFLSAYEALQFLITMDKHVNKEFVLFLDINMPNMNGWDFLDEVEKELDLKNFTIYMLSSSVDPEDINRISHYSSVQGYVTKPLTAEKMKKINF